MPHRKPAVTGSTACHHHLFILLSLKPERWHTCYSILCVLQDAPGGAIVQTPFDPWQAPSALCDARMLDFIVGLDSEFSDMVEGSHLYYPASTDLADVVLPDSQKDLIVRTVENYAAYKRVHQRLLQDGRSEGARIRAAWPFNFCS